MNPPNSPSIFDLQKNGSDAETCAEMNGGRRASRKERYA
jgi:hypothetical protein